MNNKVNQQKENGIFRKVVIITLCVITFLASFLLGFMTNCLMSGRNTRVVSEIVSIMDKVAYIYDPDTGTVREITEKDIADAIVNGLLDEYSAYYTEEEYSQVLANSNGDYEGIGLAFYDLKEPTVELVIGNSPIDRAGLKKGDLLVWGKANDGQQVPFNDANDILVFISECDSDDKITFCYERAGEINTVTVEKESYVASYVRYYDDQKAYRFISRDGGELKGEVTVNSGEINITNTNVGYIKLDSFEGDASTQMAQALSFMKEREKSKLVLDLRDNGGGYMDILTEIASFFINNGGAKQSLVAYSEGKTSCDSFYTENNKFCDFIKSMVVIANDNTASASECLIGALITYGDLVDGYGSIVLEKNADDIAKTYGKGIMQTTYMLMTGGAFKLTTARILWPDKQTCIHKKGILPENGAEVAERGNGLNVALQVISQR